MVWGPGAAAASRSRHVHITPARWGAALATAAILAACGDGHATVSPASSTSASTSTATSSTSATSSAASTTVAARPSRPHGPARVHETVRSVAGTSFASTARVHRGEELIFRTTVAGSDLGRPVGLALPAGPSRTLRVTATAAGGHRAVARLTSGSRRPVTLTGLKYTCALPPQPTFCPAQENSGSRHGYALRFTARRSTVIQVVATVGPVAAAARARRASAATVPAYRPLELVRDQPPAGSRAPASTALHRSATVRPGDTAVMVTRLRGWRIGAAQTVTIGFRRGPARSLTVTSRVGARTSTATLRSSGAAPIALSMGRFTCSVKPIPSPCPARRLSSAHGREQISFRSTPYAPVIVLATVASR
jgi:hypothetical protein